jgi:dipeptidase E
MLLVSNGGRPLLAHCRDAISAFLGSHRTAAFITAASLADEDAYFEAARDSLVVGGAAGVVEELVHVRWDWDDARQVIHDAGCVIVGGGNTFGLLDRLHTSGLLAFLKERVRDGLLYIGASAGANIAGPNVLTSNDWNVVALTDFTSLGLTEFNINPHYVERGSREVPQGETRDDRIGEYHLIWDNPVVAIEEDTLLRVEGAVVEVAGSGRARLFRRAESPRWFEAGATIDDLPALGRSHRVQGV